MINMPKIDEETLMISIFLALEGVHAYSAFLPSVFTIKTFVGTKEGVDMIREGEIMASAFLLALAGTTVFITKSPLPLILGLIAGAGMIVVYEFAVMRCPYSRGERSQKMDKAACGCDEEDYE